MQLPSLEWVNQDSAYLRQLRGGFTWLRFADELEPAFRTYHAQVHLQRMRGGLLVAIVMWLLFTVFDLHMLPEAFRLQSVAVRCAARCTRCCCSIYGRLSGAAGYCGCSGSPGLPRWPAAWLWMG